MMDSPGGSVGSGDSDLMNLRGDLMSALANANSAKTDKDILQYLQEAQEIVFHRDDSYTLLGDFAGDFADFSKVKKSKVRNFLMGFIETSCKSHPPVIPLFLKTLVSMVKDKNAKNQIKVWVVVMNLFRPALVLLCDPDWYEENEEEAKALSQDLMKLKDAAEKTLKKTDSPVQSIYDAVKTMALSFLSPNPNADEIAKSEVERGPKEKRADTTADAFSLKNIPTNHPVLSIVALDKYGSKIVESMCDVLVKMSKQGNELTNETSRAALPLMTAIQTLALYRPSVRKLSMDTLMEVAKNMQVEEGKENSLNKIRFVDHLKATFLTFLKETWRVILADWRSQIFEGLCIIGGKEQGERALKTLDSTDEKNKKRKQKVEEYEAAKRQRLEEEEMRRKRKNREIVEALDSQELIRKGYPPKNNNWPWELISNLHQVDVDTIVEYIIQNMENIPGPPPPSSVQKPEKDVIRTLTQFDEYIDRAVSSTIVRNLNAQRSDMKKTPGAVASQITPIQTILPRRMALERMLEQHSSQHMITNSALFAAEKPGVPSKGDVIIARVASNFVKRSTEEMEADLRPLVINFIAENLSTRLGLAFALLLHVFAYSKPESAEEYDHIFMCILEKCLENQIKHERRINKSVLQMFTDESFPKFFASAPRVPNIALAIVGYFCENRSKHKLGLIILRSLILKRYTLREQCLKFLLCFSVHQHKWLRSHSIQCLNQVYPVLEMDSKGVTEKFAFEMLESVLDGKAESSPDLAIQEEILELKKALLEKRGNDCEILKEIIEVVDPNAEQEEEEAKKKEEEEEKMQVDEEETKDGEEKEDTQEPDQLEVGEEVDENANLEYQEEMAFVQAEEQQTMDKEKEAEIARRIDLYVALCRGNTSLLAGYMDVYALAAEEDEQICKLMENSIVLLVQLLATHIGVSETLELFQGFPDQAIPLLIHVLRLLANDRISGSAEKRKCLLESAKQIRDKSNSYLLFETEDRFVIPVLGSLNRSDISRYMIGIVGMEKDDVKDAIQSIILGAKYTNQQEEGEEVEEEDMDSQPFSPAELLGMLINIPISEDVSNQNLVDVTELCMEKKDIFTKDVLIQVISNAIQQDPLPKLLMRIMIRSMDYQPQTKQYITNALSELVDKEIWKYNDQDLWQGFIMCATKLLTPAYPILFRLPYEQLKSVVEIAPQIPGNKLVPNLIYFAKKNKDALNLAPEVRELLKI